MNAKIDATMLGIEDHGIMSFYLYLKLESGCQGFGGWALDRWSEEADRRVGASVGTEIIRRILEVVGVEKWEDLPGKNVRVKGDHSKLTAIGHIIEDKWCCPSEMFEDWKARR